MMEGMKVIYKGFNQYSNTPILHYSVGILLGARRFPGLL
jgi:hypothetical protein